jgi:glycosyltransferase involved in cell wall biosynthesis
MKTILVKGPALSRSGYGEQTRFALRSLRAYEERFNILLINIPWGQTGWIAEDDEERAWLDHLIGKTQHHFNNNAPIDIALQVTIPNEWERIAPTNIGYTAGIETTRVSPQWLEKAQMMEKIIVVSNHAKKVFDTTTYQAQNQQTQETFEFKNETPIDVVNYPVRSLDQEPVDIDLEYDFNFLSVAQMGPRKNFSNTLNWFLQEMHDEKVGIVFKINYANCSTGDRILCATHMKEILDQYPDRSCKVYLLHGDLTSNQMNFLYAHPKIKSYLTLTHGEGFGMPIFEAAYHGLPVIAPPWSGQCDFLYAPVISGKHKKPKIRPLFCKVDYTLAPIPQEAVWDGVLNADSQWCFPDEKSAKKCIREMYANYTQYIGLAKKLKKHLIANFTEEEQYKSFANAVYEEEHFEVEEWLSNLELEVHE